MRHGRVGALLVALALSVADAAAQALPAAPQDPAPETLDAFREAVARVLEETGVPGAGIALVRADGIEWAGGVGLADRDRGMPVTADTHFRAGSVSKTFVAMALVQMSEEGLIDLEAPLAQVAPELAFENPWEATAPVRIIDLLQHTAGFDDMHFNEMYNLSDPPGIGLVDVLAINPRSRRARWRPGTRMSYSNPGYGVAGYLVEKIADEPYEDYIARRIFTPLGMTSSSFRLREADEALLARGYEDASGPPVPFSQIYLRPAGNLHTSPRELAVFVQMLLGWGELPPQRAGERASGTPARGSAFVIDPEYLSNMERAQTSLASAAGLRNGYGTGIFHMLAFPFPMLGHNGGIDGFLSSYAYSPARDVGFVVLLNSTHSTAAMARISSLAVRYLKRDVEPPAGPRAEVAADALDRHAGYYHDAAPRNQLLAGFQWLSAGRTIARGGATLVADPVFGSRVPLVPVSETLFRLEREVGASRVFTTDGAGTPVMAGMGLYAERRPRWLIEVVRVPVIASAAVALTPLAAYVWWCARARRLLPPTFRGLKASMFAVPLCLAVPIVLLWLTPMRRWGSFNAATASAFVGTTLLPALAFAIVAFATGARREGAPRTLVTYGLIVATATFVVTAYLWYWGLLGIRLWRD